MLTKLTFLENPSFGILNVRDPFSGLLGGGRLQIRESCAPTFARTGPQTSQFPGVGRGRRAANVPIRRPCGSVPGPGRKPPNSPGLQPRPWRRRPRRPRLAESRGAPAGWSFGARSFQWNARFPVSPNGSRRAAARWSGAPGRKPPNSPTLAGRSRGRAANVPIPRGCKPPN